REGGPRPPPRARRHPNAAPAPPAGGAPEGGPPRPRTAPRFLAAVEPLLARETRAGRDHDGRARQRSRRRRTCHLEPKSLVVLPPQALRPGAEPGLDRELAHVGGELGGGLTRALAAPTEQPRGGR